jgi:hypothetical protein
MRSRKTLLTLVGAAFVVGGCGQPPVVPEPGQLAVAAAAMTEAGTARMSSTYTMTTPGSMGTFTMTMDGAVDFAAEAPHLTMTYTGMGVDEMTSELIMVDDFVYMRGELGQGTQPGLPPDTWLRQPASGGMGVWQDPVTGGHPAELLDTLRDLGLPVEPVGREQVRGVDTTRYALQATVEDLMRLQPDVDAPKPDAELGELEVTFDLWIDHDNLLRRMRSEIDMSPIAQQMAEAPDGEWHSLMEFELYDFGVDVAITAPPEDEVVDYDPTAFAPPGEPSAEFGSESFDTFSDSVTAIEVAPAEPGMLQGFPEEFPLHRDAWVMAAEQTDDGQRVDLHVTVFEQADVDRAVAEHVEDLVAHGWEILERSGDGTTQHLEVAGHGWHGIVTLSADLDMHELLITVILDRG